MKISDILRHKPGGDAVVTISPDESVTRLLALLAEHRIGAVVVCAGPPPAARLAGIVSERDVVRRLASDGAAVLDGPVADIMTSVVVSTTPDADVDDVATMMTERRVRHVPVLDGAGLVGIVSIGDVVHSRTQQLELDRAQLEQYITG